MYLPFDFSSLLENNSSIISAFEGVEDQKPDGEENTDGNQTNPDQLSDSQTGPSGSVVLKTEPGMITRDFKVKQGKSKPGKPEFQFLNDVAMFHSSGLQKLKERRALMSNIGPFRRALCARRDLEMRRQLCRVDKVL